MCSSNDLSNGGRRFTLGQPRFGLLNNVIDDFLQISSFLEYAQLPIGAATAVHDLVDVFQFFARVEFIDDIVDEFKILAHKVAGWDFLLLAEIDQLAVEPITRGAPLIFHDQGPAIKTKSLICRIELIQLCYRGLNQGRQSYSLIGAHGDVTNAKLDGAEEWMRANVPPDFFGIVDAVGLDQELDDIVVLAPAGDIV